MIKNTEILENKTESKYLFETVIKNGYCIGCGVCASVQNSPFKIIYNEYGNLVASVEDINNLENNPSKILEVCPFSEFSPNEDKLSDVYLSKNSKIDKYIGRYESCYAGFVKTGDFRKKGSSGGVAKWLATKLLFEKKIDYVIQLASNEENDSIDALFKYKVFTNEKEVINGSKSSYYPVSLVDVIDFIQKNEGRYAITGIPCYIKALRLLSEKEQIIKERIKFTFGIICGGMKSANQAKMIGWQLGVHPNNLQKIDFRRKFKNRPADQKIYQVWSKLDNKERFADVNLIYGSDYGAGFFKPKACDYCDDIVAELADISIGDAWLNQFTYDPKGTSLLIIRNKELMGILENGLLNDEISLTELNKDQVIQAQSGGFRHRRQGLSYRLLKKNKENIWCPTKRVKPGEYELDEKRKKIYDLREQIAERSHITFKKALEQNNLNIFFTEMKEVFDSYKKLNEVSSFRLLLRKLKRIIIYDILNKYK